MPSPFNNKGIPQVPPRWGRGEVGREIGAWIKAEVQEALRLAGINGRFINANNIVGVTPAGVSKIKVYQDGVLVGDTSCLNIVYPLTATVDPLTGCILLQIAVDITGPATLLADDGTDLITDGSDPITTGAAP